MAHHLDIDGGLEFSTFDELIMRPDFGKSNQTFTVMTKPKSIFNLLLYFQLTKTKIKLKVYQYLYFKNKSKST